MSKMIQVRNVPDSVHGTLKSRAAREGMSLSDFLNKELARAAERPTMQEWLERTHQAKPIRATLNQATLNRATLNRATLNRATLNRATLNRATLNRATLNRAKTSPAQVLRELRESR